MSVVELPVRGCQFHGGRTDERGFLVFCGKPVTKGSSYCAEHYHRIYQRAPVLYEAPTSAEPAVESVSERAEVPEAAEVEQEAA